MFAELITRKEGTINGSGTKLLNDIKEQLSNFKYI